MPPDDEADILSVSTKFVLKQHVLFVSSTGSSTSPQKIVPGAFMPNGIASPVRVFTSSVIVLPVRVFTRICRLSIFSAMPLFSR